ncbi:hypothetical protein [Lysobacter firmicutimachus]|uniref:Uncharacterized protein n=1 Tax=Lysobacter firmicutimachus TaxID=1792846 RepID=A0ABU8CYZ8_9GAMM
MSLSIRRAKARAAALLDALQVGETGPPTTSRAHSITSAVGPRWTRALREDDTLDTFSRFSQLHRLMAMCLRFADDHNMVIARPSRVAGTDLVMVQ